MAFIYDETPRLRTIRVVNVDDNDMGHAVLAGTEIESLRINSVRDRSYKSKHNNALRTARNLDRLSMWAQKVADAIREEHKYNAE